MGDKALNFLIFLNFWKQHIWFTVMYFIYECVYEVHMDAAGYIGEGDIPCFHWIQIDIQISTLAFKVIITGNLCSASYQIHTCQVAKFELPYLKKKNKIRVILGFTVLPKDRFFFSLQGNNILHTVVPNLVVLSKFLF